jgi:hypothetical protein
MLYWMKQPTRTGLWAKALFTIGVILGVANVATFATPADASSTPSAKARTTTLPRSASVSGTPLQILSAARRATLAAHSVTLTEHLVSNGVSLSIKLQGRWPNRIRVSEEESSGFATTIILTTSSVYVNSNAATWESEYKLSSTGAAELSDRWFVTDRSDPELGSTSLSTLNPKVAERPIFEDLEKGAPDLKEQLSQFDGRPAIKLWDATAVVYVASTSRPYILRIVSELPTSHGFLDFSAFNSSTKFALPGSAANLDAALAQAQAATTS